MPQLRICFAGTPQFAADHLACLIKDRQEIVGVYTQPDRPAGRGKKLQSSPVKKLAEQHQLNVYQPASLRNPEAQEQLRMLKPDLLIVVAYGLILPQEILDIPRLGCINVHASLLPRWRGAAPIERAILSGDKVSGVTIMKMDAGLDTGPMLNKRTVEILPIDDNASLTTKITEAGQVALVETLAKLEELLDKAQDQDDSQSTYARKLEKNESLLNWGDSAEKLDRVVRAVRGRFPAFSFIGGQRIRIIEAQAVDEIFNKPPGTIISVKVGREEGDSVLVACGSGGLVIKKVQLPGKNPYSVRELLNARPGFFSPGNKFDNSES